MGKKDDAFVLKERGVVTTTIQGGGYSKGRMVFENDDLIIYRSDYNFLSIVLKEDYTEAIDVSDYVDELLLALSGSGNFAIIGTFGELSARTFMGTYTDDPSVLFDTQLWAARGTIAYLNTNCAVTLGTDGTLEVNIGSAS